MRFIKLITLFLFLSAFALQPGTGQKNTPGNAG